MSSPVLSEQQLATYHRDGYVFVPSLFDADEMRFLRGYAKEDDRLQASSYGRLDTEGNMTKLALWNDPPEAPYGLFARSPRMVDAASQLLDGEVYHYHTKMMLKEPHVGGAWEWHQDYGYWYHHGCLMPLLVSCLVSVDGATRENGCLQVIPGSHVLGRVEHGMTGQQTGADMERVEAVLERMPLIHIESKPGDVLFFHCNLLHRSDANRSSRPRWSLISCYNAARNDPYKESRHPRYTPLERVSDAAITEWARTSWKGL